MIGPSVTHTKVSDLRILGHLSTDGEGVVDKKRYRLGSKDLNPASSGYIIQHHEKIVLAL